MSGRNLLSAFWRAMQANDWPAAASYFTPECVIDWPCSGERIVGRRDFATMQARYPSSTGRWGFQVHRLVAERDTVVSEVSVTDGVQAARTVVFSDIVGEHIAHQVEYWPIPYEPLSGRADLTRPTQRIP
ncbi:MAG: nuclear transport factor 2 family protein [Sciscionella sp.]